MPKTVGAEELGLHAAEGKADEEEEVGMRPAVVAQSQSCCPGTSCQCHGGVQPCDYVRCGLPAGPQAMGGSRWTASCFGQIGRAHV